MIDTRLTDGTGTENAAKVTSRGQLVVAPLEYSEFYRTQATVINTAYNIIVPKTGKRFVITTIILNASRNVSSTVEADVVLYEAESASTTTVTKTVFEQGLLKQQTVTITALNVILSEGVWLNLKTDDNDITANIAGYYVDA